MSDVICVTSHRLCRTDFLTQIERLAKARPKAILLREKDLPERAYRALAEQVLAICAAYRTPCILHTFADAAISLRADALHLPLPLLRKLTDAQKASFRLLGASCHSCKEAIEAEALGCTYLTAGHIFATDCKKGLSPRGLAFLSDVCRSVSVPVYAIGGIDSANWPLAARAGAAGCCVMSGAMTCENPAQFLNDFQ